MLPLQLPYKKPCCCWPPRVCCHTLTTDWLPVPLRTQHQFLWGTPVCSAFARMCAPFNARFTLNWSSLWKLASWNQNIKVLLSWKVNVWDIRLPNQKAKLASSDFFRSEKLMLQKCFRSAPKRWDVKWVQSLVDQCWTVEGCSWCCDSLFCHLQVWELQSTAFQPLVCTEKSCVKFFFFSHHWFVYVSTAPCLCSLTFFSSPFGPNSLLALFKVEKAHRVGTPTHGVNIVLQTAGSADQTKMRWSHICSNKTKDLEFTARGDQTCCHRVSSHRARRPFISMLRQLVGW